MLLLVLIIIKWWVKNSFLPEKHKEKLQDLIDLRMKMLNENPAGNTV